MKKKFIKSHPAILYLFSIFLFTIIYWGFWKICPDSFIQNQELNLNPSQVLDGIINEKPDLDSTGVVITTLSSLQQKVNALQVRFISTKTEENQLNLQLTKIIKEQKVLSDRLMKLWSKNVDKYVSQSLLENVKTINAYKKELETYENYDTKPLVIIEKIYKLRVKILELEKENSQKTSSSINYTLKHASEFHDPGVLSIYSDNEKKGSDIRDKLIQNSKNLVNIRLEAFALKEEKISNLSLFDFFFYSVGIATTTTFGDIVANSIVIRVLVCIQLLLCIYVLSITIKRLTEK